ncbi:arylamine N-acetyltransferase [Chromohalobacter israelensis]|nr:hypothetical protein [Chromohalobacter salexigens]
MVLRVVVEGRAWLVDAGFGGNAPMVPWGWIPGSRSCPHARPTG